MPNLISMTKIAVIGFDAPIPKTIWKLIQEGALPNLKRLVENGVWAENCMVPHPTITPPNWTTLATGAYPGTHGITCFHLPKKGERPGTPEICYQAFHSGDIKAEFIWEAAEKVGKKAIILNYPTTWPPRLKNGIQVAGFGLHVTSWRMTREGEPLPAWRWLINLADHQCVTTEDLPLADRIDPKPCKGWKLFPDGSVLEAEVEVGKYNTLHRVRPVKLHLAINPKEKVVSGFLRKTDEKPVFTVSLGEWSERAVLEFETDQGLRRAYFKVKLLELSDDGKRIKLYFTTFCSLEGATYPPEIAKELEEKVTKGLPLRAMEDAVTLGWIDYETYFDLIDMENEWLAEAAYYLLTTKEWDIFYMHAHAPDHTYHLMLNKLDHDPDPDLRRKLAELEKRMYISLDKMVGRILEAAGEDTVVAIASDHGACPTEPDFKWFRINEILEQAGLLKFKDEEKRIIDWSQTKAFEDRSCYIWINLKSRFPDGTVEDEDYDKVCWEVINALHSYRDPKTGKCPFAFILRREEAKMLGLRGDLIGDIVFGLYPEAPGEHGRQITSGEYSIGSMKGLLILSGPGIKKGVVLERVVNIADVVPTLCYVADLPVPNDCEGAIIYQVLEDKDKHLNEIRSLKEKYRKLEETLRVMRSLTHTY
ncbi:MAG: hypothetical protein DRJ51_04130 [Thermoprotei archaeon]|nr:MAG: hypothetical protein DRJ51_04130 [Thermoprotei archaeon]